ncbi:hypothetical protein SAMD00019534_119300 [Acytostelium subglobosum LB1]|uniref:hypothetical protein n=1 Tax=Acytostelium subglobosum LB1 TaxID=1410327 RepID=UPI000644CAD3|nr:hypothetical protein SAMD00019534_119300 [Acytostelium subglobosum LB1]GAM28754.1 hypothetical protein SAMD00019534_119300 [Acytostelium subglobosum LB1]|eukprot:XP_012748309.1 hypothetical protein SAMD00019534_119300 [Acytostelium subglobosum LB1]
MDDIDDGDDDEIDIIGEGDQHDDQDDYDDDDDDQDDDDEDYDSEDDDDEDDDQDDDGHPSSSDNNNNNNISYQYSDTDESDHTTQTTTIYDNNDTTNRKHRQEGSKSVHLYTSSTSTGSQQQRKYRTPWTEEEKQLFIQGLKQYGKDYKKIQMLIRTKTAKQIRSHAQKFNEKLKRVNSDIDYHEHLQFMKGMEIYGRGKWKLIASYIQTRNPLQVKNHARIHFNKIKTTTGTKSTTKTKAPTNNHHSDVSAAVAHSSSHSKQQQQQPQKKKKKNQTTTTMTTTTTTIPTNNVVIEHDDDEDVEVDIESDDKQHEVIEEEQDEVVIDNDEDVNICSNNNNNKTSSINNHTHQHHHNNNNNNYNSIERILKRDEITDEEMIGCSEFFKGTSTKTPERYLLIRNSLVSHWNKIRPQYLAKTVARNSIPGDVNAIGRVHTFLESIGAINHGSLSPSSSSLKRRHIDPSRVNKKKTKKIKVLVDDDNDYDEEDYDDEDDILLDPFTLVECLNFTSTTPAPYQLDITVNALIVMDVHSHISSTEVIGVLAGKYDHDKKYITVRLAIPCQSLSTDIQCDMDPNSLIAAREQAAALGLDLVGWYHSHPNFPPIPSLRDIETQSSYQKLLNHSLEQ